MSTIKIRLVIALMTFFTLADRASAVVVYTIKDLGILDGGSSRGQAVNSLGQATGYIDYPGGNTSAFFYNGVTTALIQTQPNSVGIGFGINDNGDVVGVTATRSFLYSGGTSQPIGGPGFTANDINNAGQIVGADFIDSFSRAVVFSGNTETVIGPAGQHSVASAISDTGIVAGYRYTQNSPQLTEAFVYKDGVTTFLGTMAGNSSVATGVNSLGHVVGYTTGPNNFRQGFFYDGQAIHPLGGFLYGINDDDRIVGGGSLYVAGVAYSLNTLIAPGSGWTNLDPEAISNAGYITGTGRFHGVEHAFLLTPVPEPATIILATAGFAGITCIGLRRRSRRRTV
jgi:probable HAF family extracellular repeat protein